MRESMLLAGGTLVVETVGRIRPEHFVKGKSIKQLVRELKVSRNTVRKVLRSGAICFEYAREVQPLPKLGPWRADLDRMLATNEAKSGRERLTLIRLFAPVPHPCRRGPRRRLPWQRRVRSQGLCLSRLVTSATLPSNHSAMRVPLSRQPALFERIVSRFLVKLAGTIQNIWPVNLIDPVARANFFNRYGPSPTRANVITSLTIASVSWAFCCSDRPGCIFTITWGIVISSSVTAIRPRLRPNIPDR